MLTFRPGCPGCTFCKCGADVCFEADPAALHDGQPICETCRDGDELAEVPC